MLLRYGPRLERAGGYVGGADREAPVVRQAVRLLAVALAGLPVALPALGRLPDLLAARDDRRRWLRWLTDEDRCLRPLLDEVEVGAGRVAAVHGELVFAVLDHRQAVLFLQHVPGRQDRKSTRLNSSH